MLRWAHGGFCNKRARTHNVELLFSHLVGYVGHVVDSDASVT
jgi:hypothetical protein